jgi:hypothetical protein
MKLVKSITVSLGTRSPSENHSFFLGGIDTHSDYKEALLVLESMRQQSIHDGRQLYNYQTKVSDHQFTLEIRSAEEEYKVR